MIAIVIVIVIVTVIVTVIVIVIVMIVMIVMAVIALLSPRVTRIMTLLLVVTRYAVDFAQQERAGENLLMQLRDAGRGRRVVNRLVRGRVMLCLFKISALATQQRARRCQAECPGGA